jgi:hypothetical protein
VFHSNISVNLNYGFFLKKYGEQREEIYSFGMKYWFTYKNCQTGFSPFIGLSLAKFGLLDGEPGIEDGSIIWEKYYFSLPEIPIGISYTYKNGLQTSLQISYYLSGFTRQDLFGPNIELKLGWRFNLRKGKEATPK